jgi:hypothetical protein
VEGSDAKIIDNTTSAIILGVVNPADSGKINKRGIISGNALSITLGAVAEGIWVYSQHSNVNNNFVYVGHLIVDTRYTIVGHRPSYCIVSANTIRQGTLYLHSGCNTVTGNTVLDGDEEYNDPSPLNDVIKNGYIAIDVAGISPVNVDANDLTLLANGNYHNNVVVGNSCWKLPTKGSAFNGVPNEGNARPSAQNALMQANDVVHSNKEMFALDPVDTNYS